MKVKLYKGLRDGIPIALGYFAVSFALGIMAVDAGLTVTEATLVSLFNLTSAGQFAGITVMGAMGGLAELALTQLVINLRYSLMAVSLSQKTDKNFKGIWRAILGYGITDEIFAVACGSPVPVTRSYFAGLMALPIAGWTLGTLLGAVFGNIMPEFITNSLGVALYGMFIAIIVPQAKADRKVLSVTAAAAAMSIAMYYAPGLNKVSSGFAVIICSVTASLIGALLFGGHKDEA